jgi:nucleotide-binding universal stress UspA family protein
MSRQRTILVGYDGLDAADRALARAVDEARAGGAKLVVLAVSEMPLNPEGPQNFGTLDDSPATMIPLTEPPELASVLGRAGVCGGCQPPGGLRVGRGRARAGDRRRGTRARADLVVVGHHHHGLMGRLFGEDVAAGVKRAADCEVIAVD